MLFDGTFYYTYDAAGNRTAQYKITSGSDHSLGTQSSPNSEAADITIYTWNNANEMTAAAHFNTAADWHDGYYQTSGEYTISYAYDAFGRMVTRTAATGYNPSEPVGTITDFEFLHVTTENFVYWGQNNVLVLDGSGQVIDRNLTGLAPDQVFATEEVLAVESGPQAVGTVNWLLTDNQGTVRDVVQFDSTTDTTAEVDHLVYSRLWGVGLAGPGLGATDPSPIFYYNGVWQDPQTGLYDMGARWYDAVDAVFASYDPLGFGGGQTNLSEDCVNSPTNLVDPSGMWTAELYNIVAGWDNQLGQGYLLLQYRTVPGPLDYCGLGWIDLTTPANAKNHYWEKRVPSGLTQQQSTAQGLWNAYKQPGTSEDVYVHLHKVLATETALLAGQNSASVTMEGFLAEAAGAAAIAGVRAARGGRGVGSLEGGGFESSGPSVPVRAPGAVRPTPNTSLPGRVTGELAPGEIRTPEEVAQARNFFERNRDAAQQWWSERNGGRPWPEDATNAGHPRPLADGGDPLFIEPEFDGPNAAHMVPGPDGLTDFQRWGARGGRPPGK